MYKILKFENKESWLEARRGKITGTRVRSLIVKRGSTKKIGFYELIAERLGIAADDENPLERGNRLEPEAIDMFRTKNKTKNVNNELVLWVRDDNDSIAVSPDASIGETEAIEVKCLASSRHIEALVTQEVPKDHEDQVLQYFVVNDKLKKLHLLFYDPRVIAKRYFVIEVNRKDVQKKVDEYLEFEIEALKEVNSIVTNLTF